MYKAVMLSDIHCSNSLPHAKRDPETMVTDRLLDTIGILEQVARFAHANKVKNIWVLGDLMDKRLADAVTLKTVSSALLRMVDSGLNVNLIPGNHEASDGSSKHFILDAMVDIGCWVAGTSVPVGTRWKTGGAKDPVFLPIPYQSDKAASEYLRQALRTDSGVIPLIHQSIKGGRMGNWVCPDGVDADMLSEFRAVFSGHFHTPQVLGKGNVQYLGAPLQHNFGDEGETRGWHMVSIDDHGDVTSTLIPSSSPKFHTLNIDESPLSVDAWMSGEHASDYVLVKSTDLNQAKKVCAALIVDGCVRFAKPSLITRAQAPRVRLSNDGSVGRVTWQSMLSEYVGSFEVQGVDRTELMQKGMELINAAESQ